MGIDRAPLVTWQPASPQHAFRLEVSADRGETTVFSADSSRPRLQLPPELMPSTRYRWRVQTRTDDAWSDWSATASFETGPLSDADWCGAEWIGGAQPGPAPTLSAAFSASGARRPRLYLCGLGVANAVLNGKPIGPGVIDPPPTAYDRILPYRVFDLSSSWRDDRNTLSVTLGRGFFAMNTPTAFNWHVAAWRSEPLLRAVVIDLDDPLQPLLVSGRHWQASTASAREDSFYAGEVRDFGFTATDSGPALPPAIDRRAIVVSGPSGELRSVRQSPVTRRGPVAMIDQHRLAPDRVRFDLAANVAALVSISTADPGRPTIVVQCGEKLDNTGAVVATDGAIPVPLQRSELRRMPADTPVCLDLTYSGLRYVEVSGTTHPVTVEVERISAAPTSVGTFRCSDTRLQRLHEVTRLTLENCVQGTPIDTPLYEKQGYTGDAQLLAEALAYNYWMPTTLAFWLRASVFPSQSPDGSLPGIAPTPAGNWIFDTPSPAWDAAIFELPTTLLDHYGDIDIVRDALPVLRRYLDYLNHRFPDGIVPVGLGDWNPPGHVMPPESPVVLSTAYYARFLTQAARFADRLGLTAEAMEFTQRAAVVRKAFHRSFWQPAGFYAADEAAGYRETDNLLALAFDLVPPPLRAPLAHRVEQGIRDRGGHLDTGMVGARFLLPTLSAMGQSPLAFEVARGSGYPGWQYWIDNGATTLYENWELDGRSHNHAMFGSIEEWFYRDVAGLAPGAEAWGAVRFSPHFPADDTFEVEASVETIAGPVGVAWQKSGDRVVARVTAPIGISVTVPDDADVTVLDHVVHPIDTFTVSHEYRLGLRSGFGVRAGVSD